MEQPSLGKKIVELRKAKRLTQEELVEKCNISIRTIQRIEAGDVTPRDYTIKAIFTALEYDLSELIISDKEKQNWLEKLLFIGPNPSTKYLIKQMNITWIFGVFYFFLRFFEGGVEYSRFIDENTFNPITYIILKVCIIFIFLCFQRGFVIIGALFKKDLLRMAALILMLMHILMIGFDVISIFSSNISGELVISVYAIGSGIIGLIYGYTLIQMRDIIGSTAMLAGIVEIIAASFSLTIILSFMGFMILSIAVVLEILIVFKVIEIVKNGKTINIFGESKN